jgi:hypothetical protein
MNKNLSLKTRKNFVKSYVWTLTAQDKKKIESMEMWTWKRLLRISWTERKSNEEILRIVEEKRVLLSIIRSRSGKLIGHIMSHNLFIINIMEGRINERKGRGRPRKTFIGGIIGMAGCNGYSHMKTLALKREEWRYIF